MARVSWATISTGVFANQDNSMVIENPLSIIKLESIPSLFTFYLAFSVIEMNETREYVMNVEVGKEDGEKIVDVSLNIDHVYDENNPLDVFMSDATLSNVRFAEEGVYYAKINVDNSSNPHIIYFIVRKVGD